MSVRAYIAVWAITPRLRGLLAEVPEKRRPKFDRVLNVALRLADKYQDSRGYVDETNGQLTAVLAYDVRPALATLDAIGVWVVAPAGRGGGRGGKGPGQPSSARTALELGGADPAQVAPEQRGADPTVQQRGVSAEHRGVGDRAPWDSTPSTVGFGPEHRGADPHLPVVPEITPRLSPLTAPRSRALTTARWKPPYASEWAEEEWRQRHGSHGDPPCSIEGCDRTVIFRGVCDEHAPRCGWIKHDGNPCRQLATKDDGRCHVHVGQPERFVARRRFGQPEAGESDR